MPWCTHCDRFLSPSTVRTDGTCPTCGKPADVESGRARRLRAIPWHIKLLIVVFGVYLLYRLGQGIDWLIGQL
ncbi:MAG: hypothetical protein EXQ79_08855 [Acidimicrobiia bacterium]|nr:hypothetical protein [Acidimicrobiia bacterium]